jgi:DNA-binding NtrC family response regulator
VRSRILCISKHPEDVQTLSRMLYSLPVLLEHAGTLNQARIRLFERQYDAVLTESSLPDGNWLDALHMVRELSYDARLIVTDPQADSRLWSEVLNLGAYDLLTQPFYEPEVRRILSNASTRPAPTMAAG